ncbi:MAG: uracil-DNA glycosylase family protein [bacterium]
MTPSKCIKCKTFPCTDIDKKVYLVPLIELNPGKIKLVMVSEAPPVDKQDYFYAAGTPNYLQTTLQAFNDAGIPVKTMADILKLGVYITTAVKCAKTQYAISLDTIKTCSRILESELALFPTAKVYMLMGDVAIKSMNAIAKRTAGLRVIPNGSTYKIRKQQFYFNDIRVFPSYLQTGGNYLIEKAKRRMIAEDIQTAFNLLKS